ncbi:hypothetical protein LTS17_004993 [Exophiala oligosperma]
MKFTTRRVSTGFPISRPQLQLQQLTFPPPPTSHPPRPRNRALHSLHKFRTVGLPVLLVLVFTTLILNAIYAYCVAKPHTDIADQLSKSSTAEANGSLFGRRSGGSLGFDALLSTRVATTSGKKPRQQQGTSEVALLFYTLFTPAVSLVHLCFEFTVHHATPRYLRSKTAFLVLTSFTALAVAGWITTLAFWMHCELPSLDHSGGQAVCPPQVRGHFMYGIHEVSIAKIALGWLAGLAYAMHVLVLVGGYKAQRRAWRMGNIGDADEVTEMTVGFDMKGSGGAL